MIKTSKLQKKNNIFSNGCFLIEECTNKLHKTKNKIYENDLAKNQLTHFKALNLTSKEFSNNKKLHYRKIFFN